jgi:hypothetical protein
VNRFLAGTGTLGGIKPPGVPVLFLWDELFLLDDLCLSMKR